MILVDDGIATGGTVRASLHALGRSEAARVLLGVPVGPMDVLASLGEECDLRCSRSRRLATSGRSGAWYRVFDQLTDERVIALLDETILK